MLFRSNIEIPTTQKGYTKSDGEKVERIKGEVILEIDPKLTMSLFDIDSTARRELPKAGQVTGVKS